MDELEAQYRYYECIIRLHEISSGIEVRGNGKNYIKGEKGRFAGSKPAGGSKKYVNGLDKSGKNGIIKSRSDKVLKVNTGGRRNESPLSEEQINEIRKYAVSLGMPEQRIYYVDYDCTGYGVAFDLLRIGTDVYPSQHYDRSNANSNVSMRGAIAHEVIGHRKAALAGKSQDNEILEEAQASIRAAKFTMDLNQSERIVLYRDAITRLRNANIKLKDVKNKLHIYEE